MDYDDGPLKISSMKPADLKHLIQRGEGLYLEFKKRTPTPEKIAREMAALANTRGGKILVGVSDDGKITGITSFFEEEYLLTKAAEQICRPPLVITMELVQTPDGDVLLVEVPEATDKPVWIPTETSRLVYVRQGEESVLASEERTELLKHETGQEDHVTFEYGDNERQLFRFLHEYGEITVDRYAQLIHATTWRSSRILINLVRAGILELSNRDNVDYFVFSVDTNGTTHS